MSAMMRMKRKSDSGYSHVDGKVSYEALWSHREANSKQIFPYDKLLVHCYYRDKETYVIA